MPQHRVASACSTVTAWASIIRFRYGRIAVLAGGNVHAERTALANVSQAGEVVGADRLLKPTHTVLSKLLRKFEGLHFGICAVCIDEQLDVGADGLPGYPHAAGSSPGGLPTFILTRKNPSRDHPPS